MDMSTLKWHLFCISALIFMLTSCNIGNKHVITYEDFPKKQVLSADSVPTKAIYDNVFMNLANGTLVISSFKADTMMHFYSTPSLEYEFGDGIKGHGHNEVQSFPSFCQSADKYLYVRGFTENTIKKFSLSNTGIKELKCYGIALDAVPNDMHIINDSLLYYNDLGNTEIKSYNLNNRRICHRYNLSDTYRAKDKDALVGSFCANNDIAIYAFQYKREIVVLRTDDLSYIKTIKWNGTEDNDKLGKQHTKGQKLFYTYAVASPKYFYLLYRGISPTDSESHYFIEKYDKEMNPVCKYNIGREIYKFAADETNGYIYAMGNSDEYIYKYKM